MKKILKVEFDKGAQQHLRANDLVQHFYPEYNVKSAKLIEKYIMANRFGLTMFIYECDVSIKPPKSWKRRANRSQKMAMYGKRFGGIK